MIRSQVSQTQKMKTRRTALSAAALPAALAIGAALVAGPAAAQIINPNVYVATLVDDVKPIIVYVLSDPNTTTLAPIEAFAFYADPEYQATGGVFNAREACIVTLDFDLNGPGSDRLVFQPQPVVDSATWSASQAVDLPTLLAQPAVRALRDRGIVTSEAEAAPHFNCASFLWSELLNDPALQDALQREIEALPR